MNVSPVLLSQRALKQSKKSAHPLPCDSCQLILDRSGAVIESKHSQDHNLNYPFNQIEGQCFREILVSLHAAWDSILPHDLALETSTLFLPWSMQGSTPSTGYVLERMQFQDYIFVTLRFGIAPHAELREASFQDLPTDKKTVAELVHRMQQSESRLHHYMHNFPGVFFSQRPDFSFNYIGPDFETLTGHDAENFSHGGSHFLQMILDQDRDRVLKEIQHQSSKGKTFTLNYRIQNPEDNSTRYLMEVRTPKLSPSGLLLGYDGVWVDVTRQSIAESHLISTAWKESLATLTGGLVHDFSNVMAGIFCISELYFDAMDEDNSMRQGLGQIKKHSLQAQKLVRRLIELNREVSEEQNYHNLEHLIEDQLDLIPIILPKNTKITTQLIGQEIPVYIDDVSFRQLLLNFTMNTRDALCGKGEVSISLKTIKPGESAFEGADHGQFVADREGTEIRFTDNGSGIPAEHLERVFEPFFTTKEASKGSGFGLYNARLFIEANQGKMGVYSRVGEGTTFYIYLPTATFTESEATVSESRTPFGQRRTSAVVYGSKDPETSNIVALLRSREWEVITFDKIDRLKHYLDETHIKPNAVFALDIGNDPLIESLIDSLISKHPDIERFIQIRGMNPDDVSNRLRQKVRRVFDECQQDREIVQTVSEYLNP